MVFGHCLRLFFPLSEQGGREKRILQVRRSYDRIYKGSLEFTIDNLNKKSYYLYSAQLLMRISSGLCLQNAVMKAEAKRAFVTSGIFRSMAARRSL